MKTIAFVTSSDFPGIAEDDQLLVRQLERYASCIGAAWDDPAIDWSTFDATLIRSCWNYHKAPQQFISWINRIKNASVLANSARLVLWNMNKRYLRELQGKGIPVPATVWLSNNALTMDALLDIMVENNWRRAVLKPSVSASSFQTSVIDIGRIERTVLSQEISASDMMLQEFLTPILDQGELSLIFLSGQFSHAVIKKAKPGDFRVQHQFGGSSEKVDVSQRIISDCERILEALPEVPLYARVDGVVVNGIFTLMELELIEPVLFLCYASADAVKKMATNLIGSLDQVRFG